LVALLVVGCGDDSEDGVDSAAPVVDAGADGVETDIFNTSDAGGDPAIGDEPDLEQPSLDNGDPCDEATNCAGGSCLTGEAYPGGYCTHTDCGSDAECTLGDTCVTEQEGTSFCAAGCFNDAECRNGYACLPVLGTNSRACLPEDFFRPEGGAVDGEPCTRDDDCRSNTCILEEDWPQGYCTTLDCENFEDCQSDGEDNRCLIQEPYGQNLCVRICDTGADCREGYICQDVGGGLGFCAPSPFQPLDIDPAQYPFDISCGETPPDGVFRFDYDVATDTTAYMVTPFAPDGTWIYPYDIERPSGASIELRGSNSFQLTGAQLFGYVNPTIVPALSTLGQQLESGSHTYILETETDEVCWYLLEESSPGTQIDMNIYLVGVPGLSAESAPSDPDIQAMLDTFDEIYASTGVQLGEVRYFDITGEDQERFEVLRSEGDLDRLLSLSALPGDDLDDALSVNIFFVRSLAVGGGAIGISLGLPGPAGLHGTGASGVIFTSEFLGQSLGDRFSGETVDGSEYTGIVFAHEVGHYLGLFHTTEQYGQGFDPIDDTARCSSSDFPNDCEDLTNLMFPFAGIDHRVLTEGQSWVIGVNPLTKE
jgi:hypothetical protein